MINKNRIRTFINLSQTNQTVNCLLHNEAEAGNTRYERLDGTKPVEEVSAELAKF